MDGMARIESCGMGRLFSKQAAEGILIILLGAALIMSQVFSGMTDSFMGTDEITNVESIGSKLNAGNSDDRNTVLGDAGQLILKRLLLEERPMGEFTEQVIPKQTLVLPDVSDGFLKNDFSGNVGNNSLQTSGSPAVGEAAADPVVSGKPSGIVGGTVSVPVVSENPSGIGGGILVDPVISGDLSGIADGTLEDAVAPTNPSGIAGGMAEDIVIPGNLSGIAGGTLEDAVVPENPSDTVGGTLVDPVIPENLPGGITDGALEDAVVAEEPSGIADGALEDVVVAEEPSGITDGALEDAVVPEEPSGIAGGTAEDIVEPEDPSGGTVVDPVTPENPSEGGTTVDAVIPDVGDAGNEGQLSASCFLLDEMGMLYAFLPEYAEIPDGCLTLPAECTGIRRGAFSGCGAGILELYIPAEAVTIEEGALADLVSLEWIDVESGNSGCVSDSGVLFDSTMSVLLAFPAAWMDIYSVPSYVTRIADRAFDGTSIYRLDIRECGILSFGEDVFGSSGGSGIEVAVREPELVLYGEILSGYAVTLTK